MKKYENYRKIGLPWLEYIPFHWKSLRNKNIFKEQKEVVGENFINYTLLSLTLNGIVPRNMDAGGKFPESFDKYKIVKKGNIAFCLFDIDETPRTVGVSEYDGMLTNAYTIMSIRKINGRYIYYYYLALDNKKMLKPLYTGLRKTIGIDTFQSMKIPVPPRTEQDQIVRFLDWKVSEINKLIGIRKKEISELESLKLCHMTNVITKGLNNDIQKKSTSSKWIGDIPTHWDLVAVRRVYKVILGKMLAPNRNTNSDKLEEYICAKDVHFDGITLSDLKKMWFSKFEREQYRVGDGDLLVVEGGAGAGNAALLDKKDKKDVYVQNSVHIIRAKDDKAINSYLCFWLFSLVKRGYMESVCSVATIPHYTKDKVLSTVMPLPPLAEQQKIVEHLEKYSAEINALILKNKNAINEMLELKNTIISDVVTGKIDVRNVAIPAYEHIDDAADAGDGEESAEELAEAEEMEA